MSEDMRVLGPSFTSKSRYGEHTVEVVFQMSGIRLSNSLDGRQHCGTVKQVVTCDTSIQYQSANCSFAALPLIQLHASVPGKASKDSTSTWAPATQLGDPEGVPGSSCLQHWMLWPPGE